MIFPYVIKGPWETKGGAGAAGASPEGGTRGIKALAPAVLLLIAALVFSSCAGKPPPGPKYLHPATTSEAGYSAAADQAVLTNEFLTIIVTPLRPENPRTRRLAPLFAGLLQKNFVIINAAIKNNSQKKLIYNPAFTRLIDSETERREPLDYPALYEVLAGLDKDASPERLLKEVRGLFHDRNLTLGPGDKTSKLLLFLPISEEADSAILLMDEIYIGTDTVDVSFPFVLTGVGGVAQ